MEGGTSIVPSKQDPALFDSEFSLHVPPESEGKFELGSSPALEEDDRDGTKSPLSFQNEEEQAGPCNKVQCNRTSTTRRSMASVARQSQTIPAASRQGSGASLRQSISKGRRSLSSMIPSAGSMIPQKPSMPLRRCSSVESVIGSIEDTYHLEKPALREGTFSNIFIAHERATGKLYAVKSIPFSGITEEDFEKELTICRLLKHPNVICLHDTIRDDGKKMHDLVMDYCPGGDLLDWVMHWGGAFGGKVQEVTLAEFLRDMLAGLEYIHSHHFCHRDVKIENFMLESKDPHTHLKLIDFACACEFKDCVPMTLRCGTVNYSSPQVIQERYSEKCDIWSLGICFHMMCVGCWPFFNECELTFASILASEPQVFGKDSYNWKAAHRWAKIRGDAKAMRSLLKELLKTDENARPSARQFLKENTWLKAVLDREGEEPKKARACALQ